MHVTNKSVAMSGSGEASPRWAGGSGTTLSHLRADGAATANNAGGKTQCTGQQRLGAWGVKGKFVYFKGVFSLWISLLTPRFLLQAVPQRCRENHCSFCKQAASARLPKEHQEEISENVLLSRSGLMSSYCNWAMTACVVFAVSSLVQSAQSAQLVKKVSRPSFCQLLVAMGLTSMEKCLVPEAQRCPTKNQDGREHWLAVRMRHVGSSSIDMDVVHFITSYCKSWYMLSLSVMNFHLLSFIFMNFLADG